jgi:hypothetical protein
MRSAILKLILTLGRYAVLPVVAVALTVFATRKSSAAGQFRTIARAEVVTTVPPV